METIINPRRLGYYATARMLANAGVSFETAYAWIFGRQYPSSFCPKSKNVMTDQYVNQRINVTNPVGHGGLYQQVMIDYRDNGLKN